MYRKKMEVFYYEVHDAPQGIREWNKNNMSDPKYRLRNPREKKTAHAEGMVGECPTHWHSCRQAERN